MCVYFCVGKFVCVCVHGLYSHRGYVCLCIFVCMYVCMCVSVCTYTHSDLCVLRIGLRQISRYVAALFPRFGN